MAPMNQQAMLFAPSSQSAANPATTKHRSDTVRRATELAPLTLSAAPSGTMSTETAPLTLLSIAREASSSQAATPTAFTTAQTTDSVSISVDSEPRDRSRSAHHAGSAARSGKRTVAQSQPSTPSLMPQLTTPAVVEALARLAQIQERDAASGKHTDITSLTVPSRSERTDARVAVAVEPLSAKGGGEKAPPLIRPHSLRTEAKQQQDMFLRDAVTLVRAFASAAATVIVC